MGLESAAYVSEFNLSNPAGGDLRSQGDNHMRMMKTALQATFPNADRPFRFPNSVAAKTTSYSVSYPTDHNKTIPCDTSSGGYTVTLPDLSAQSLSDGFSVNVFKNDFSSNVLVVSGSSINGLTTKSLYRPYQIARLVWCATAALWVCEAPQMPPVGSITAYSGTTTPDTTQWVICDGVKTIGSASAGSTVAAAYTRQLFEHLWASYSNTVCPVSTGRGLTAAADFLANKRITTPDLRGRCFIGLDAMGGSAASRLGTVLTTGANGETGGAETVTLTEAHLAVHAHGLNSHTHSVSGTTGVQDADHVHSGTTNASGTHTHATTAIPSRSSAAFTGAGAAIFTPDAAASITSSAGGDHTHTFTTGGISTNHSHAFSATSGAATGTTENAGSSTAHNNLPPVFAGTWLMAF